MHGFSRIGPAVNSGLPAVVTFQGESGYQRPESEILGDLRRLLPGDIAYGHVHASPGALALLCQEGWAVYFILRDPRDVVVSHVHYVTEMAPDHIHHYYYHDVLQTFDQRLWASILGFEGRLVENYLPENAPSLDRSLPGIRQRFEPFMGWLEQPQVLTLHYEDLMHQRDASLACILDHAVQCGFQLACDRQTALQKIAAGVDPQRSPTFRSGKVGDWRASFNEQHKQLFKEVAGDLLVRLGYEKDLDW
jgi:hypothetical protein